MDFCETTKELWHIYFSGEQQDLWAALKWLAPDCVIIGTGAHEFYTKVEDFAQALNEEIAERKDIAFQFKDLWCRQKALGEDACLVYGAVRIWWESDDKSIFIDMDSRFSVVYQRIMGEWKIVLMHQSVPNREQADGEYYPKALSEQLRKAQDAANEFAKLAEQDGLTGLSNYAMFQKRWQDWQDKDSWLFMMDLDDFKSINDTYGHMEGNRVLQEVAAVLSTVTRSEDVVCRMGGDEFLLLCGGLQGEEAAAKLARRILKNVNEGSENARHPIRISIGGTAVRYGEPVESAIERADRALYEVKKTTKNRFQLQ